MKTPTTIHALLEFENGAVVTLNASWDVWQHGHAPMELYGEDGTLHVPDPNFFGGEVAFTKAGQAGRRSCRNGSIPSACPTRSIRAA